MKSLLILLHIVNKYGVLTTQNKQTKKKEEERKKKLISRDCTNL